MLKAMFVNLFLVASPATGSAPEPAPAPRPVEKTEVKIEGLENAVLTIKGDADVKFEAVKTAKGTRVRVTIGDITLEATRLEFRHVQEVNGTKMYRVLPMWIDQKDGKLYMESKVESIPKPKQP